MMTNPKNNAKTSHGNEEANNNNIDNQTTGSCCTPQRAVLGVSFTITQILSVFFFLVSALPYMINFDGRIETYYEFPDLNLIKTIWLRVHVFSCTINLFIGPIQVMMGLLRKAGNSKIHKYLGYAYTLAMILCVTTSIPLIVLRYADTNNGIDESGGPWIATPLTGLTAYVAATLFLGIRAVIILGDKPLHRRMLFRNYCGGVFVFVTFRIGIVIGGIGSIAPSIAMILTFLATEGFIYTFPPAFEDNPTTRSASTDDEDWQIDDETVEPDRNDSNRSTEVDNTAV